MKNEVIIILYSLYKVNKSFKKFDAKISFYMKSVSET